MTRTTGPAEWSTREWHAGRARARHLEDPVHRPRLELAADRATTLLEYTGADTLVDIGAGDGGFLELVEPTVTAGVVLYGYDFTPANVAGAGDRGVAVFNRDLIDVLVTGVDGARPPAAGAGDRYVVTLLEVLEHLIDPVEVLAELAGDPAVIGLVASVPRGETAVGHSEGHLWAWPDGSFAAAVRGAGWLTITVDELDNTVIVTAIKEHTP